MRARRLLDEARQTLSDDLSDLGQAVKTVAAACAARLAAQAVYTKRRLRARLYKTKKRLIAYVQDDASWASTAEDDPRRAPGRFYRSALLWAGAFLIWVGLIAAAITLPAFALIVTVLGAGAFLFLIAFLGWKTWENLRQPAFRAAVQGSAQRAAWRARAGLHHALRTLSHWLERWLPRAHHAGPAAR